MSTIQGSNRLLCDQCNATWIPADTRYPGQYYTIGEKHYCSPWCYRDAVLQVSVDAKPTPVHGRKDDSKKLRYDLLPAGALAEVVKVLTFGASKYWDDNWQKIEAPRKRYTAAMLRHVESWRAGERNDPESGAHHLAHAICCGLFLIWGDDHGF